MAQRKLSDLSKKFEKGSSPDGEDFGYLLDSTVNSKVHQLHTGHEELNGDLKLDIQDDKTVIHTNLETTNIIFDELTVEGDVNVQNDLTSSSSVNTQNITVSASTVNDLQSDTFTVTGLFEPTQDGIYNLGTFDNPIHSTYLSTSVVLDSVNFRLSDAYSMIISTNDTAIVSDELIIPAGVIVTLQDNALLAVVS